MPVDGGLAVGKGMIKFDRTLGLKCKLRESCVKVVIPNPTDEEFGFEVTELKGTGCKAKLNRQLAAALEVRGG